MRRQQPPWPPPQSPHAHLHHSSPRLMVSSHCARLAVRSKTPSAISPGQEAAVGAWKGSLVAASSLRPPPAGETLTPVQVAVAGVVDLPPGERRARVASLAAAARIVAYMSAQQVNTLLGRPASLTAIWTSYSIHYCSSYTYDRLRMGGRYHRRCAPHVDQVASIFTAH